MKKILQSVDSGLAYVETGLIILILGSMVLLSFLQVLMRNFFDTGILWGDIFLRHLVLWVGFIGASLATREEKHINIDLLTRLIPKKIVPFAKIVIDVTSVIICLVLVKAGWEFVSMEIEANTTLFQNVPSWYFEIIIPVGFALIALRFVFKIIEQIISMSSKRKAQG
jgi:TRAP-type C4-dicarboxylate transport system permease small subunit